MLLANQSLYDFTSDMQPHMNWGSHLDFLCPSSPEESLPSGQATPITPDEVPFDQDLYAAPEISPFSTVDPNFKGEQIFPDFFNFNFDVENPLFPDSTQNTTYELSCCMKLMNDTESDFCSVLTSTDDPLLSSVCDFNLSRPISSSYDPCSLTPPNDIFEPTDISTSIEENPVVPPPKPKRTYKRRIPKTDKPQPTQPTRKYTKRKSPSAKAFCKSVKLEQPLEIKQELEECPAYGNYHTVLRDHCYAGIDQLDQYMEQNFEPSSCSYSDSDVSTRLLSSEMDQSDDDEIGIPAPRPRGTRAKMDDLKKREHNRTEKERRSELTRNFRGLRMLIDDQCYNSTTGNASRKLTASKKEVVCASQRALQKFRKEILDLVPAGTDFFQLVASYTGNPMKSADERLQIDKRRDFDLIRSKRRIRR